LRVIKDFSNSFNIPLWLLMWDGFDLGKTPNKTDKKLKKEVEELIPKLQGFLFKKISKNHDNKI